MRPISPMQMLHACIQQMTGAQFQLGRGLLMLEEFDQSLSESLPGESIEFQKERPLYEVLLYYRRLFLMSLSDKLRELADSHGIFQASDLEKEALETFQRLYEDAVQHHFYEMRVRSPGHLMEITETLKEGLEGIADED